MTTIYCKTTAKGTHSFYLVFAGEEYYLFSQDYRKGVFEYYRNGVELNKAMQRSKAHYDTAILKTMDKLPIYIKYIEREYDIVVLEQTKRKAARDHNRRCA
ncbi:MAG: hypothetical protein K6G01_00010 [Eubacterium sp.]|nr:hypothetical protein [Eubacterium sp.]